MKKTIGIIMIVIWGILTIFGLTALFYFNDPVDFDAMYFMQAFAYISGIFISVVLWFAIMIIGLYLIINN